MEDVHPIGPTTRPRRSRVFIGLALVATYAGAGYFSASVGALPYGSFISIWLTSGVGLIAFQVLGARAVPWVLAGGLAVNAPPLLRSLEHLPLAATLLVCLLVSGGGVAQSFLAWRLAARLERRVGQPLFTRSAHLLPFTVCVCVLVPLLTVPWIVALPAVLAAQTIAVPEIIRWIVYVVIAAALGLLLAGPLHLAWTQRAARGPYRLRQHLPLGLTLVGILALFFADLPISAVAIFPVVLHASRRYPLWETAISVLIVAFVRSLGVAHGVGPLGKPGDPAEFVRLSTFLGSLAYVAFSTTLTRGELAAAEDDLQRRVEERTAELLDVTRQLEQEIDQRRAVEQELRLSETRYRLLAETTRDIIVVQNSDETVAYVNQAGLLFSGFSMDEVLGRSISAFGPPDSAANADIQQTRRLLWGEDGTVQYDAELLTRSGQRVPVEVNLTPLPRSAQGDQILIVARDVTERRRAEAALRDSEERYRHVMSSRWPEGSPTRLTGSPTALSSSTVPSRISWVTNLRSSAPRCTAKSSRKSTIRRILSSLRTPTRPTAGLTGGCVARTGR